ncbi:MAG: response regulator [Desulfobacterales bacterium]|nr:response regulator [Desulfobacterales bacterium]
MKDYLKILVVDDEEIILSIFREYLEATNNYTVLTATDGFEALEIIKTEEIDCCFTDISMPRLDGLELTKRIHLHDNTIPVIIMTGNPSMNNAIETLKNGVVDFLTKPIKMDQLNQIIDKVMMERSLFVDNILLKEEAQKNRKLLSINQELQQKIKEVESMNLILQQLDQAKTSKDLFSTLVELSGEITSCDEAHFSIFTQEMTTPKTITSFVRDNTRAIGDANFIERETIKKVAADGMPFLIKKNNGNGSVMAVPLKIRSKVFGILFLLIGAGRGCFSEKDLYFSNFLAQKASFSIENLALYENIYENLFSTLYAFVETIEARDPYTKQHSTRVSSYAMSIAGAIGCSQEEIDELNVSGNLHDIGKIGIPDSILLKPGRLTDEEYEVIKKHPVIGSNIIGHFNMWSLEERIIRHHHERWDGKGYPDNLKENTIPFLSRILSVSDVYDALTSDRSYRTKMQEDVAVNIIIENAGSQFDPEIVDVFLKLHSQGKITANQGILSQE